MNIGGIEVSGFIERVIKGVKGSGESNLYNNP